MIRAFLLATSIGLAATGALALERPAPDALKACPHMGQGFYEIPGTTTCIRIGGQVRAEYQATTRRVSRDDVSGFRTTGRVTADARTETPYGPLRAVVSLKVAPQGGYFPPR